jgi:enterochelin esterase family protein
MSRGYVPALALCVLSCCAPARAPEASRVTPSLAELERRLASASTADAKRALVEAFAAEARAHGTPLVRDGAADFVYLAGPGEAVRLSGCFTGWNVDEPGIVGDGELAMHRVGGTDLLARTVPLRPDARVEYRFYVGERGLVDPWNPHRNGDGEGGLVSSVAMPGWHDTWTPALDAAAPRGRDEHFTLQDGRAVTVHLPAGYDAGDHRLGTLYLFDGRDYAEHAGIGALVDALIHRHEMAPVILVLVDPIEREAELKLCGDWEAKVLGELVPRIDGAYRTDRRASARGVGGVSLGGLAAMALALSHPDVFQRVLAQSPMVDSGDCPGQPPGRAGFLIPMLRRETGVHLRAWLSIGVYDFVTRGEEQNLARWRRVPAALREQGHEVHYVEPPMGHNWTSWRSDLVAALPWVFPAR